MTLFLAFNISACTVSSVRKAIKFLLKSARINSEKDIHIVQGHNQYSTKGVVYTTSCCKLLENIEKKKNIGSKWSEGTPLAGHL